MKPRDLPSIDELLGRPGVRALLERHPRAAVVRAARAAVAEARRRVLAGEPVTAPDEAAVEAALRAEQRPNLRRVINATGVVLHTNLGRAPMAPAALDAVRDVARGYANLELDLATGERGSRYAPVEPLVRALTGAEAALVVNNCAAAVLLVLSALAEGKEGVVSRGELVEIGGGFRVPDVMRQSGCKLVEVGTTNRTRAADYAAAAGPDTALFVKVHRSNFALVGFTEEASLEELVVLARTKGVRVFHDLGSGALVDLRPYGLPHEPGPADSIAAGADVVTFSGDKLLGGPQAGIIAGRADAIAAIARHPLNRALRIDKLTVASLEASLRLVLDGRASELPALRFLGRTDAELAELAEALHARLAAEGVPARIVETRSRVGGGSLPTAEPPSRAVSLAGAREALAAALREGDPAVVARVSGDRLLLDVRAIEAEDLSALSRAVGAAFRAAGVRV